MLAPHPVRFRLPACVEAQRTGGEKLERTVAVASPDGFFLSRFSATERLRKSLIACTSGRDARVGARIQFLTKFAQSFG
jgi:hypothetical protein